MNFKKISEKNISTKIITYKTKNNLKIVETIENGEVASITIEELFKNKEFGSPIMLNLPKNWIKEYENFYTLYEYKKEISNLEEIEEEKIYFLYSSGHMLFDANKNIVSVPYIFNYIGSLRERYEDDKVYRKLMNLLEDHPYVLKFEEKEIESYNSNFDGQKGIHLAKVYIPQEKYDQLYDRHKGKEYWSVNMGEEMKMACVTDIYGKEIENLLKEYFKK